MMAILNNQLDVSTLVDGLDHAEGVAWGLDGFAYAGGEAGQVYRVDVERGELSQFAQVTGGFILGMALDADNNVYACDTGSHSVVRITQGGVVSTYSTGAADEPFHFPNYPAFDSQGNLYVAASGDWDARNGKVFKIAPGGAGVVCNDELVVFPMVCAWGPTGSSFMW